MRYVFMSSTSDFKLLNKSSLSKAVNFWSLNSRIALACSSSSSILDPDSWKEGFINLMYWVTLDFTVHFVDNNFSLASDGVLDFLIRLITESILLTAIDNPIKILAFSLALLSLYTVSYTHLRAHET